MISSWPVFLVCAMSKPRYEINPTTAARLKALRRERHITQEQLAEMVDRHELTIRLYENGRLGISPRMLDRLAAALGVTAAQIRGGEK